MSPLHASIAACSAADLVRDREALADLLADAVASNASVGYVWPLDRAQYAASWDRWIAEAARGERDVLVARVDDAVAGCVHFVPCPKPNQRHRADIAKLLVHQRFGRRGLGRALMRAVEGHAIARKRHLLVLDTRTGSAADALYRSERWNALGIVPGYALDPDGAPGDCTFFWKRLDAMAVPRA
jgi:ribosomal protein S18 acetylase RimI-like enzyme